MKSWENKLSSIEQRINIQDSPSKVCVVFQDGKTMPEGADLENTRLVVEINGISFEDI